MERILKALISKNEGGSFFNTPIIYLLAACVISYVLVKETSNGVVYFKHGSTAPLDSTAGYLGICFQLFFLILAAIICVVKIKKYFNNV